MLKVNTKMKNALSMDDVFRHSADLSLPPRYRFRDLLLGDYAFRDDGER